MINHMLPIDGVEIPGIVVFITGVVSSIVVGLDVEVHESQPTSPSSPIDGAGVVAFITGVVVSVAEGLDVEEDDIVLLASVVVPVDVGMAVAESVVDLQPLASIDIKHRHNRLDSFILRVEIALFLCNSDYNLRSLVIIEVRCKTSEIFIVNLIGAK